MDRQPNRQLRGDDRPIKGNPTGKYNMDFIDWNNEWSNVYDNFDFTTDHQNQQCPIFGMSKETFLRLVADEFQQLEWDNNMQMDEEGRLPDEIVDKVKKMKMGTSNQSCAICVTPFQKGEIIRKLPCKHIFHDSCILPWFSKKSNCPNCRFDIKEYYMKHQEESNQQ
ncbi:hypothetical protein ABPG74_020801 [Tetrahymena malaccensis]